SRARTKDESRRVRRVPGAPWGAGADTGGLGMTPPIDPRERGEDDRGQRPAPFVSIEEAIQEIRQGRMLVVVDDEDRENEGDLLMAADRANPEAVNFMAKHGRGLTCVPL